jgi:hypothetical protein
MDIAINEQAPINVIEHRIVNRVQKCSRDQKCFSMQRCLDDALPKHGLRLQGYRGADGETIWSVVYHVAGLDQHCWVCPFCLGEL